ncbi:MAG: YajQ family cyclic di-GMP-binding protein [Leptospiraceae bacterium]|nr:YajQ family cyclic di-GMP-binding protein [Leptospiraceae bacterium]MDW8306189.1 YajQ family cyclic di-GMP-binding protein [Leptospiraceae bacterium]
MAEHSFDIVSEINRQELANAVDQTQREISTRFDFKGTKVSIELAKDELILIGDDENKLNQLKDVFHSKCVKRGISLKAFQYGKVEPAAGGTVRQKVAWVQGIAQEHAKKIHQIIKDLGLKVKSQTLEDKIRVSGKSKDDLQAVIHKLKSLDFPIPLQFTNYR